VRLIGPNCPGVLSPGRANVGIIPAAFFSQGNVGVVSRSGTLTYQIGNELAQRGFGNSSIVGIGGDPVPGSSFIDIIALFEADPETELIVMSGEIGGSAEEEAAEYIAANVTKPVVGYERTPRHAEAGRTIVEDVRRADALVIGSPGYHGSISGLVKNVLDYLEELADDQRPYVDGRPVGCIATAQGWQGAVNSLVVLRQIVHALRGSPTPFGLALNVEGGLDVTDPGILGSIDVIAGQILDFTSARSARERERGTT
jgi:NAD(P)H-dependent FMN reductase